MSEIITITYLEDDSEEKALAINAKSKLESLGRLCVLNQTYFDEYGADGPSPIIDFADGTSLRGKSAIIASLEL